MLLRRSNTEDKSKQQSPEDQRGSENQKEENESLGPIPGSEEQLDRSGDRSSRSPDRPSKDPES
jgi:hypothetical protein